MGDRKTSKNQLDWSQTWFLIINHNKISIYIAILIITTVLFNNKLRVYVHECNSKAAFNLKKWCNHNNPRKRQAPKVEIK